MLFNIERDRLQMKIVAGVFDPKHLQQYKYLALTGVGPLSKLPTIAWPRAPTRIGGSQPLRVNGSKHIAPWLKIWGEEKIGFEKKCSLILRDPNIHLPLVLVLKLIEISIESSKTQHIIPLTYPPDNLGCTIRASGGLCGNSSGKTSSMRMQSSLNFVRSLNSSESGLMQKLMMRISQRDKSVDGAVNWMPSSAEGFC